jgi:hypothetical protein
MISLQRRLRAVRQQLQIEDIGHARCRGRITLWPGTRCGARPQGIGLLSLVRDYARAAGSGAGAVAALQSGRPTGTITRPPVPFATPAAEVYQATSAVSTPT